MAYPLGNQRIEKSYSGISVSTAKTSANPKSSVNCDIVQDIRDQTPPVSEYGNWRIRRKRWRKRKHQDKDTEFPAVPTNFSDNAIARYDNTAQQKEVSKPERSISEKFTVESIEVDTSREERARFRLLEETRYCRICRATFNAPAQAKQHYSGRLHKRMVKAVGCSLEESEGGCNLVDSTASSSSSSPSLGSSAPSSASPSPVEASLADDRQVKVKVY